ncbi:MAG TPA: hypothetical protein VF655_01960 [Allosphingosinicella sp.]|jgi:hypothetical protein
MKWPLPLCVLALLLSGCDNYPRDPEGTLQRVKSERVFRVGLVAPLGAETMEAEPRELLRRLSERSGASPRLEQGPAEPLLDRLQKGELDLVLGRFEKKSPWSTLVTFAPPLRVEKGGKTAIHLTAAMRNGENAWISLVEREARDVAEQAR